MEPKKYLEAPGKAVILQERAPPVQDSANAIFSFFAVKAS